MILDLDEAVGELFSRRINCGHQTLWDGGGVTIWLGDDINGRKAETTLPPQSLRSAGPWLIEAARRLYPDEFLESPAPAESGSPPGLRR